MPEHSISYYGQREFIALAMNPANPAKIEGGKLAEIYLKNHQKRFRRI